MTPATFQQRIAKRFIALTVLLAIATTFAHPSLPLVKRTIGPDLGSDHLPVTVTFGY